MFIILSQIAQPISVLSCLPMTDCAQTAVSARCPASSAAASCRWHVLPRLSFLSRAVAINRSRAAERAPFPLPPTQMGRPSQTELVVSRMSRLSKLLSLTRSCRAGGRWALPNRTAKLTLPRHRCCVSRLLSPVARTTACGNGHLSNGLDWKTLFTRLGFRLTPLFDGSAQKQHYLFAFEDKFSRRISVFLVAQRPVSLYPSLVRHAALGLASGLAARNNFFQVIKNHILAQQIRIVSSCWFIFACEEQTAEYRGIESPHL